MMLFFINLNYFYLILFDWIVNLSAKKERRRRRRPLIVILCWHNKMSFSKVWALSFFNLWKGPGSEKLFILLFRLLPLGPLGLYSGLVCIVPCRYPVYLMTFLDFLPLDFKKEKKRNFIEELVFRPVKWIKE